MKRLFLVLILILLGSIIVPYGQGYLQARFDAPRASTRDTEVYRVIAEYYQDSTGGFELVGVVAEVSADSALMSRFNYTPVWDELSEAFYRLTSAEENYDHWAFWHFEGAQMAGPACLSSAEIPDDLVLYSSDECPDGKIPPWREDRSSYGRVGPNAHISMSRVGYGLGGKRAEVMVWYGCGSLCGYQVLFVLTQSDQGWNIERYPTGLVS